MTRVRSTKPPVSKPSAALSKPKPQEPVVTKPAFSSGRQTDVVQLTAFAAKAIKSAAPGPYEMVPGRYKGVVSLPAFLSQLGTTPQGQAAVGQLLTTLKEKTGLSVPPEVQAALLSNPSGATTALELTPRQLSNGVMGLNAAYQAGKVKPVPPPVRHLPQSGFDLANIAGLDLPRTAPEMKQVAPGLFTGSLPSTTPDAELKANTVMAEVFDRLSRNASADAGAQFSVTYQGQAYTRLDDLLGALKANGNTVKVAFEQRTANFADLKTPVPGSSPTQWLDVPAPLMVRTGIRGEGGKEAVLPAAHSEMIITVSSGPDTKGPKLDAGLRWFQGIDGTGFFPKGGAAEPEWLGRVTHATVEGDDALKTVAYAGALGDVIGAAARDEHLYAEGYGATGVCNDTVAVIEQAILGRADQYPLLMHDELLFGELKKRLEADDKRDVPVYAALRKAIDDVPSDIAANPSARARALKSIPWVEGQEPFDSTVAARKILAGG